MKFSLEVPHKTYDIDEFKLKSFEEHIQIYMNMYLPDITSEEIIDLKNHKKYVRFMCFQDDPTSRAYMCAYCRKYDDMTREHKELADIENIPMGYVLGEINYVKKAFFFIWKM